MSEKVIHVTDSEFEDQVLKADGPVLVDYWAEWCGPCTMIGPLIDELAESHEDQIKVTKLDIDANPQTPQRYAVRGIPTLMIFKDGEVQATKVGALTKKQLEEFVADAC